jgi:hypothetical protein
MTRSLVLVGAALISGAGFGVTETSKLGIFTDEGSVGQTPPGCHYGEPRVMVRRARRLGRLRTQHRDLFGPHFP